VGFLLNDHFIICGFGRFNTLSLLASASTARNPASIASCIRSGLRSMTTTGTPCRMNSGAMIKPMRRRAGRRRGALTA
jgi:hypothetical protein